MDPSIFVVAMDEVRQFKYILRVPFLLCAKMRVFGLLSSSLETYVLCVTRSKQFL
jgi:hypothetical protein